MTTPPTSARGYVDDNLTLDGYGTAVDYLLEHQPDLRWPESVKTFARMRRDPQLAAIVKAYTHPIRKANWALDPAGCRDQVVADTADDLGLPVKGADDAPGPARRRGFSFAEHLRVSLLDQTYGHMFFEQAYAEVDGRWRLDTVAERMPQTIAEIKLNRDGTLRSVVQEAVAGRPGGGPEITTADHRLVHYVNEREGSNYFGQSLLRPAFGPWLIKDQVLRVHATSIRRFGLGILEVQAPPGGTPAQVQEAQRYAASIKASENSGAGLPAGFTSSLRGMQGSVPDAVAFLNFLDRQMTRMALASILDMATSENGARALGDTVLDVLMLALQAVADEHAAVATSQIVVPLVTANWGDDEPAPRVVVSGVAEQRDYAAMDLARLLEFGGIFPDPNLNAHLRQVGGLPEIDKDYVPQPAAETTTDGGA